MSHTSLLTSLPVTPEGDVADEQEQRWITPDAGVVLEHTMLLRPYTDFHRLGQAANVVGKDEVPNLNSSLRYSKLARRSMPIAIAG